MESLAAVCVVHLRNQSKQTPLPKIMRDVS
jgi:hypothetical protein